MAGGRWGARLAEAAGRQPSGQEREVAGKSKEEKTASERRKPGQPRRLYLIDWGTAPAASTASREGGRSCHQSLFSLWLLDRRKESGGRTGTCWRHLPVAQLSSGENRAIEVESLGVFGI